MLLAMGDPMPSDFSWADDWFSHAYCLSVVEGLTAEEALLRLVEKPVTPILPVRDFPDLIDIAVAGHAAEATAVGGWAVIVERNGFLATMDPASARLSDGTRAGVVFRNVNALMDFIWAVDGQVVRRFDPLFYTPPATGWGSAEPPRWSVEPLPEEEGLTFGMGQPIADSMALLGRLTGIELTEAFLDRREDWLAVGHNAY